MSADPIASFWEWWPTVAGSIAKSFQDGGLDDTTIATLSERVHAIHPGLAWEFGPGAKSAHHLSVSSNGDPTVRIVAERWRKRAPAQDQTWEFHASRQPHPKSGYRLGIAGHEIALDQMTFAVTEDETREKLDVRIFHPAFAAIEDRNLRLRVSFIALDTTLGEDDVERWIGAVELADAPSDGAIPLTSLRDHVASFAAKATRDKWIILRGIHEGRPVFVTINAALKRIDHLLLDTHVEITLTLAEPTADGLTTRAEAATLETMEDELTALLGAEAVYYGRETGLGRRTLHFHVMEGGPSAALIARWRARHEGYAISIAVKPDPLWEMLDRFR